MTLAEIIAIAAADPTYINSFSSNEIWFGNSTSDRLTDVIADVAEAVLEKADADHTHTGYAAAGHTHAGYAAAEHEHTGYAVVDHAHTGYAPAVHEHTGYAAAQHSHTEYAAASHGHSYNDLSDKPTIPAAYSHPASHPASMITGLAAVATSGSYNDLADKPAVPAAYTHPESHPASMITGLAGVATSGSYNDLSDKPTIPTIPASLPANGGNADTVDGKHASDFATASHSHDYAASGHTHTPASIGAAAAEHTHNYAASGHTHTPASIGAAAAAHTHDLQMITTGITTTGNGAAYVATVPGITALTAGVSFLMIPHVVSTAVAPTLNVNGLGAKAIRRRLSNSTVSTTPASAANWLGANKPITVIFDGSFWIADFNRPNATDLYGTVPVANGGTGATTAAAALTNLGAFPATGGDVNGDVNVKGVIRANGQQAFYYAESTASQTIGTGNATGGTTIACGSSANVNINGANVKMANALPKTSNTYYCGNSTLRWKGIYSNAEVNVASDERLKRNILPMDNNALAAFIGALQVKSYNYTEDAADAHARIGLVAQDVQKADAELAKFFVQEDETGMLGLTPADLVFPLIAAVQQLSARVKELEAKG